MNLFYSKIPTGRFSELSLQAEADNVTPKQFSFHPLSGTFQWQISDLWDDQMLDIAFEMTRSAAVCVEGGVPQQRQAAHENPEGQEEA